MRRLRNVLVLFLTISIIFFVITWILHEVVSKFWEKESCCKETVLEPPTLVDFRAAPNVVSVAVDDVKVSEKEQSFDDLLNYILHPRILCKAQISLGGFLFWHGVEDGDKKICLNPGHRFSEDCVVISVGVGNEWSFEESIHQAFNCSVYAFDPSLNMDDHMHSEGVWFFNKGINDFDGPILVGNDTWQINKFETILKDLKLENRTIDVFKMDIEGGEYSVMTDMLNKGLLDRVKHFCLEIHFDEERDWNDIIQLLRDINEKAGMILFSTRNNTLTSPKQVPGIPHRREQLYYELAWMRPDPNKELGYKF